MIRLCDWKLSIQVLRKYTNFCEQYLVFWEISYREKDTLSLRDAIKSRGTEASNKIKSRTRSILYFKTENVNLQNRIDFIKDDTKLELKQVK